MAGNGIKPISGIANIIARASQQLYAAPSNNIAGIQQNGWYSPMQPVAPVAPAGTEPKGFQFWAGQNLNYTPRPDAEFTAADLKTFAAYDLVRVIIENVKDVICQTPWEIHVKKKPGEKKRDHQTREAADPIIAKLTEFFECPDGENMWPDWVRPLIEDMLVIDAASVLLRKTMKGDIAELRVIRGESITRYIDENGYTPKAPSPAYAQNWWGLPLVDLTVDQLVYKPRNIVPRNTVASQMYGMSPVEQAAEWISIGLLRLKFQKAYYTDGSIPGAIHIIPPEVPADKIKETMEWMNSELAGQLERRRQWRMIQGFNENGEDQVLFPKEALLTDPFDDLIIRCLCFAFGTSPQRLMKMMNRASAESSQESADAEGYMPFLHWLRDSVINFIIQRRMGYPDYEMVFVPARESDPKLQMEVQTGYVKSGLRTINEGREAMGDDSSSEPNADKLGIVTATGFVPIEQEPVDPDEGSENPDDDDEPKDDKNPKDDPKRAKKKALKAVSTAQRSIAIDTSRLTQRNRKTAQTMHSRIERWFDKSAKDVASAIRKEYGKDTVLKLTKADDDTSEDDNKKAEWLLGGIELSTEDRVKVKALFLLIWSRLKWVDLAEDVEELLSDAGVGGVEIGKKHLKSLLQEEADRESAAEQASLETEEYASARSASLVGMERDTDGKLVPDVSAKRAITELTRKDLLATIVQAVQDGWTANQLAAVIEGAEIASGSEKKQFRAFSSDRAELIADTETINAQAAGTFATWIAAQDIRRSKPGVAHNVIMVRWRTSEDERVCDVCNGFEEQGPQPLGHEFAPGIECPTAHPRCACILEIVSQ